MRRQVRVSAGADGAACVNIESNLRFARRDQARGVGEAHGPQAGHVPTQTTAQDQGSPAARDRCSAVAAATMVVSATTAVVAAAVVVVAAAAVVPTVVAAAVAGVVVRRDRRATLAVRAVRGGEGD